MSRDEEANNLRTEYSALSSYFNTVVSFRFTSLGFYLAAVGLICKDDAPTVARGLLLLLITVSIYLIELRNRTLYKNLACRGAEIERIWWGEVQKKENQDHICKPYFNHMMHPVPKDIATDFSHQFGEIRHSYGINLLFVGVFLYALIVVIYHSVKFFDCFRWPLR